MNSQGIANRLYIMVDIIVAICVFIMCMMISLVVYIFIGCALFKEKGATSMQQGHYQNGQREGEWKIISNYRLYNGNDGRSESIGTYKAGLREGVWRIETPY